MPGAAGAPESQRSSIIKQSLQTYFAQAILLPVGLLTSIVTARALGPAGRGELSLLVVVPTLTATFGTLGLEYSGYYRLARAASDSERGAIIYSLGRLLAAATLPLVGVTYVALAIAIPQAPGYLKLLASSMAVLAAANLIATMLLLAAGRTALYNLSRFIGPGAYAAVLLWFWLRGGLNVALAFSAWALGTVLTIAMDCYLLRVATSFRLRRRRVPLLAYGLRSHVATVSQYGALRIDQLFLGILAPSRDLGLYAVAVSIAEVAWYAPNAVGPALLASRKLRGTGEAARATVRAAVGIAAFLGITCVGLYFAAELIVRSVFGMAYVPAVAPLRLLLPGIFFLGCARLFLWYFLGTGSPGIAGVCSAIGFVITIAADVVLIPPFGVKGAAVASTTAYTVVAVCVVAMFVRELRQPAVAGASGKPGDTAPHRTV